MAQIPGCPHRIRQMAMTMARGFSILTCCASAAGCARFDSRHAAPRYRLEDIGSLVPGGFAAPYASSNTGYVTGVADASDGKQHAFLWFKGKMRNLTALQKGSYSSGYAVNDLGQVVGESEGADGTSRPFFFANGRSIGLTPAWRGVYHAINSSGCIAGSVLQRGGREHACLLRDAMVHDLGTFPAAHGAPPTR